jgi:hypothetical protein
LGDLPIYGLSTQSEKGENGAGETAVQLGPSNIDEWLTEMELLGLLPKSEVG